MTRGTSVVMSLKLFALPHPSSKLRTITIILSTNRSYVISPCVTNTDQWLTSLLYYKAAKYSKKRRVTVPVLLVLKEAIF